VKFDTQLFGEESGTTTNANAQVQDVVVEKKKTIRPKEPKELDGHDASDGTQAAITGTGDDVETTYFADGTPRTITQFDARGNVLTTIQLSYDEDGLHSSARVYHYDQQGNPTAQDVWSDGSLLFTNSF